MTKPPAFLSDLSVLISQNRPGEGIHYATGGSHCYNTVRLLEMYQYIQTVLISSVNSHYIERTGILILYPKAVYHEVFVFFSYANSIIKTREYCSVLSMVTATFQTCEKY